VGPEWLPFLLAPVCTLHGYTVQSYGMQERLAAGPRRAAAGLCFALHAIDRGKLRGDEARDGVGKRSARTAEGNHAVYYGKWREASARGYQRLAPDRRFEGANSEHVSDADEPTGKPGSREHAEFVRADRADSLKQGWHQSPSQRRRESGPNVAGVEGTRDGGIFCPLENGAAVGEDGHLIRVDAETE
jgi:hypothetical protein